MDMDLLKRREVLVNLISRVGRGQQNIYRWVDELISIDAQLEHQEQQKQETKIMFKINVTELHPEIQKKLADELNGVLNTSGLKAVITTSLDPEDLNWYEIEVAIYGDIDTDSDRLHQCVSWDKVQKRKTTDPLLKEIQAGLTCLDDWHKYQHSAAPCAMFKSNSLEAAVDIYCHNLPRKYWGETFVPTGKGKTKSTYNQSLSFSGDIYSDKTYYTVWEYAHADGHTLWCSEKLNLLQINTEEQILALMQGYVRDYCKREKITFADLVSQIDSIRARWEQDRLAKIAAEEAAKLAIPMPDWFQKEVKSKGSVNRFWIGDDYIYSFWWDSEDGTAWQQCEDRTRGLDERTRESKSLGSNRDVVMNHINSLLAERKRVGELLAAQEEQYQQYKFLQQKKGFPIKSFEKWLQTA